MHEMATHFTSIQYRSMFSLTSFNVVCFSCNAHRLEILNLVYLSVGYHFIAESNISSRGKSHIMRNQLRGLTICLLSSFLCLLYFDFDFNWEKAQLTTTPEPDENTTFELDSFHHTQGDQGKRAVYKSINPAFENRKFLIDSPGLCSKHANLSTFIFVQVAVESFDLRNYARQRWLSPYLFKNPHVSGAFFVGLPTNGRVQAQLEAEADFHGDIIQGDFIDTYKNMSIKSVAAIEWISKYCTNTLHIIKVDGDVFVNIVQVMAHLDEKPIEPKTFYCSINRFARPKSITVPNTVYPHSQTPSYCAGAFYVHRTSLIEEYVKAAMETPYTIWSQDVFMTGVLRVAMKNVYLKQITSGRWSTESVYSLNQYTNCKEGIKAYAIHVKDHVYHAGVDEAWAAALVRLPENLKQNVNETMLSEARKIFPGCK